MGWGILGFFRAAAGGVALSSVVIGLALGASADGGPAPPRPSTHRAAAPAAKPVPPVAKPVPPAAKPALPPPIVFFLAKGDANACGPGCNEWIAAEGTMDAGADGRLRALLKKIGKRKLPIFFHLPGGAIPAGLEIGRILRQHAMTAGVGRTVPAGCDPKVEREPACDKLKHSGRELVADLDTTSATCNSACVVALVGATVRDIGPGVRLGIHSASIKFTLRRIDAKGHVTSTPAHVAPKVESRALQGSYGRIAAYLHEMGIAPGLLEAARKIPSESVRYLTREEIVAFGIDQREVLDGLWVFVDQPAGAAAAKIVQWRESAAGGFRRMILRLSCAGPDKVRFQFGREAGAQITSLADRFRLKFGATDLPFGPAIMTAPITDWLALEIRTAYVPMSLLREASVVIEAIPSPATPTDRAAPVTVQNLGAGLTTLANRCAAPPRPASRSSTIEL